MGVWTESATSIPVRVLPAWYETWWLRSLAALGLIALIAATVRLRTMGLERNHRALVLNRLALEREVARRTVDLERSQSALERSNATLAASAETLRRLGEIGRLVTASLDSGDVLAALCRNVGSILDAESVAIWLPDGKPVRLRVAYGVGHGEALPTLAVPLDDPDAGVARAARERRDILIESPTGAHATALFGPLLVQDQLFGVLAVETSRPRAYGEREQFAFASFCAYGATALANAEAHRDLARANAELGRLASHDSLTGLANRRYFFDMAVEEVARAGRYRRCLSLLVVDLDTFKSVNDTYGHLAGDAALQAASRCLQQSLRQTDLAARYGGEEFIALLPETGLDGAVQVAERFRALLAATEIRHNDVSFRITASVGVAAWRFGEAAIEPAIDRADRALYRVKSTGRNRVAREPAEGNGADVQPGAIS
jgi:diguanylate cyclase (GGDEF)-like protein